MSPEAQRIAIAEACGWTPERRMVPTWNAELNSYAGGYEPKEGLLFFKAGHSVTPTNLPDYLNDLNAMHYAWLTLPKEKRFDFFQNLCRAVAVKGHVDPFDMLAATAAQRAEAFLRTIGKWEGQP